MTRQDFAFCGAGCAAVYLLGEDGDRLVLAESAEAAGAGYGMPSVFPLAGRSPVAETFRTGRPDWLGPAALAARTADDSAGDGGPDSSLSETPGDGLRDRVKLWPDGTALAVLPLGGHGGRRGCLVVAGVVPEGFDADRRLLLELYADQVAARVEASQSRLVRRGGPVPDGGTGLVPPRSGSFSVDLDTGAMTADEQMLDLLGLPPGEFDGRATTLVACAVPDDVPALMSVVEPGQGASSEHQLAFRVRCLSGELRWLGLRCRILPAGDGARGRMLGVVADASYLRPSADEVSRVQRLSAELAGATTVREVSETVAAALRDPLGATRVAVAEVEAERLIVTLLDPPEPDSWPDLWRSEWRSEWPDAPSNELPTLRRALRDGTVTAWLPGADLEPGLLDIGPGGLAVLPLQADGRVVGVCLVGWDEEHRFVPEERSLLTATASLVGRALTRAHALDARAELARTLQRSLLPRKLPELPGGSAVARYLPATVGLEVGGDWYDVIPLPDHRVALVIGDVQGHSAEAATIMGQMRTAIRAYAVEGHPPDVVLGLANRLLTGMETDLFATCCYVDLDLEQGSALLVRAGHTSPVLRRPDGAAEEVEVRGGPPLGVLPEARYPMTEAVLEPGTVLTLLTDGLVESARLPLDEGMARLRALLSAADPVDLGRTADELLANAERRDDDVALLLLRYDGTAGRPLRARWPVWRLPDAVVHARRFTERTLRTWGVTGEVDVSLLIVSELVTNAVTHTRGRIRLDLTLSGERLRIGVNDASPRGPVRSASLDLEATGGRGLLIVGALASDSGSLPFAGGKRVWAETTVERAGAEAVAGAVSPG
ncbi:SpoIIE family protein phosphatase [Streptomyces sp. NPDC006798]|uniref:SpoIIE family protein phosphatase n=1 Tax=Streptomyces sp. NPDC006798 TaxID=3155462 RepID=UPI0033D55C80